MKQILHKTVLVLSNVFRLNWAYELPYTTDDLLVGLAEGIGDTLVGMATSPYALIMMVKSLISGDMTIGMLAEAGLEGLVGNYAYVISNGSVMSPFKKNTDAEVREFGIHAGAIICDIVMAFAGGAIAAKVIKSLTATKAGAKIAEFAEDFSKGVCFTEDTLVSTSEGYKPIKEIKIGDKVYSENPETGEKGLKTVKNVFVKETSKLVHVNVNGTEIKATPTHPFWVVGTGWVEAGSLVVGDKLLLYSGKIVTISGIKNETLAKPVKVYNFEVEGWHTYFVSEQSVLVHNSCQIKTVEDILKDASPLSEKRFATQLGKSGGYNQALKDFNSMGLTDIRDIPGGKVGKLPDGRTVNVRSYSSETSPTLEIYDGKRSIKVRYSE